MTVEEFKKIKPEFADIEGELLWNAMEDYLLSSPEVNIQDVDFKQASSI